MQCNSFTNGGVSAVVTVWTLGLLNCFRPGASLVLVLRSADVPGRVSRRLPPWPAVRTLWRAEDRKQFGTRFSVASLDHWSRSINTDWYQGTDNSCLDSGGRGLFVCDGRAWRHSDLYSDSRQEVGVARCHCKIQHWIEKNDVWKLFHNSKWMMIIPLVLLR